jgi:hypothetical protein
MVREHKAPLPSGIPNPTSDPRLGRGVPIVDADTVGPSSQRTASQSGTNGKGASGTLTNRALRGPSRDHRLGSACDDE